MLAEQKKITHYIAAEKIEKGRAIYVKTNLAYEVKTFNQLTGKFALNAAEQHEIVRVEEL